jgi:ribosome maturation factor RimP
MNLDEHLSNIVEREVELLGFELVKLDSFSRGRKRVLRIFIDKPDGEVTIDDCVQVTKAVGHVLDLDESVRGPFNLEVSSPGSDRPLVKKDHFERFKGHSARVQFSDPDGSKRTVQGLINGFDKDSVIISSNDEEVRIELSRIIKANLHGERYEIGRAGHRGKHR